MTSSGERRCARVGPLLALALMTACGGEAPVAVPVPRVAQCNGAEVAVQALEPFESVVLTGEAAGCFALAGGGREYLVAPQLTGSALPYGGYPFRLGDPSPTAVASIRDVSPPLLQVQGERPGVMEDAQRLVDARMRAVDAAYMPQRGSAVAAGPALLRAVPALPESLRAFSVLSTLDATPAYRSVRAALRYSGARVLIYLDTLAAAALDAAEITAMGQSIDTDLLPAMTEAFGSGSDIDANGRVIFLLTPAVNALVSASSCGTSGFVRGFFYSHDLSSIAATSNRGEIFYAYVPDAAGRFSCAHSKQDVLSNLPPTFVHELQHMISFGEHAVKRNGVAEEVWLNEGLSHLAEELGAKVFETKFPAPNGRTSPTQLFPDSAAPYITPNVQYSYRYLFSSGVFSVTSCAPGTFCSLSERGGTWLFLRWIADRQDVQLTRRLVSTALTGRANLEAATGRTTASLLGGFALGSIADSLPGVPRAAVPAALRFTSRNLRVLYRQLFETVGILGGVSRPFPVEPAALAAGAAVTGTMRPGTFIPYRLQVPQGTASAVLRFVAVDGAAFPLSSGAQVSILRVR